MCKLPHRMATFPSSQQKQVPAEQGINAMEHLLAGKKTLRTAPAGMEKGENMKAGSLSWYVCPGREEARLREQRVSSALVLCRAAGMRASLPPLCEHEAWEQVHFHLTCPANDITEFLTCWQCFEPGSSQKKRLTCSEEQRISCNLYD